MLRLQQRLLFLLLDEKAVLEALLILHVPVSIDFKRLAQIAGSLPLPARRSQVIELVFVKVLGPLLLDCISLVARSLVSGLRGKSLIVTLVLLLALRLIHLPRFSKGNDFQNKINNF